MASRIALGLYFFAVAALVARIAWVDRWTLAAWALLLVVVSTFAADRASGRTLRSLTAGAALFGGLVLAVTYVPGVWFSLAYALNHGKHYLWNANVAMASLPGNDGRFLWSHRLELLDRGMRFIYLTGFDMVVWIPVVRALLAFDAKKVARYALGAHIVQFPLIMPFYAAFRVDEVWSVLGHGDRCERGWSDETRLDLGANCFPSMHTSVAFAVLLLSLREKSLSYRVLMCVYTVSIIVSTVYMEIHWLVDVLGGLLLGAGAVKIVDAAFARFMGGPPEPAAGAA